MIESSSTSATTARRPYGSLATSGAAVTTLRLPAASRNTEDVIESNTLTCAPTATRTRDLLLRRQSLYPLSYRGPVASLPAGHVGRSRVAGAPGRGSGGGDGVRAP